MLVVVVPLPILLTGSLNYQAVADEKRLNEYGINAETNSVVFTTEINTVDFSSIEVAEDNKVVEVSTPVKSYSDSDLDLLARLIHAEAGCNWMTDELQMSVGNVVLNRVSDDRFPNTIGEVIYQKGQYACIKNGMIDNKPSEQAVNNARRLLEGERVLPENVIWQSEFPQGDTVYKTYPDEILGNTTYFCY